MQHRSTVPVLHNLYCFRQLARGVQHRANIRFVPFSYGIEQGFGKLTAVGGQLIARVFFELYHGGHGFCVKLLGFHGSEGATPSLQHRKISMSFALTQSIPFNTIVTFE